MLQEFTQECHIDFAIAVHLCEPLKGHSGTVKAIACVQDRVVVGSTDGKVQVWRPWSELYKNLQKQKSFRRTMTRLKSQKFGFDQSNMFAHDSTEEEGEEEEEQIAQDCEWSLFQVMDHGSAVTAMADVRLEVVVGFELHGAIALQGLWLGGQLRGLCTAVRGRVSAFPASFLLRIPFLAMSCAAMGRR